MFIRSFFLYLVPIILGFMILKMATQSTKPLIAETVRSVSSTTGAAAATASAVSSALKPDIPNPNPFPSFFFSHGGPTFMYENDKGAFKTVKRLGKKIKNVWKPDYIVVVSAHWQLTGSKAIEIAIPPARNGGDLEENALVYDFYGFPRHMYKEQFRTMNSRFVSGEIRDRLKKNGFHADLTKRGIDHGVWVPFKVAFSDYNTLKPAPEGVDVGLDLPETSLVQVSLTGNEKDFDTHYKLGEVLSYYRDNLIWDPVREKYLKGMVIVSGMSVHNLRDLGRAMSYGKPMPYAATFNKLLTKTMVNTPDLLDNLNKIKTENGSLLFQAHPTLEHFVPIVVGGGLLKDHPDQQIKEVFNSEELSLGWGIYQFGEDPKL